MPVVLFTKESLDTDKPILVIILPPLKFTENTTKQGGTGNIKEAWDPDRSVKIPWQHTQNW